MDSVTSRYQRGIEERCRDGEARLRVSNREDINFSILVFPQTVFYRPTVFRVDAR